MKTPHQNILVIKGEINENTVREVEQQLGTLDKSAESVCVYISSMGGCVHSAFQIFRALRRARKNYNISITTIGLRRVCSAAFIIFLAGDNRYSEKRTVFSVHEVAIEGRSFKDDLWYSTTELRILLLENEYLDKKQAYLLARSSHGKISRQDAMGYITYRTFFTAAEARDYGIIEAVIQRKRSTKAPT